MVRLSSKHFPQGRLHVLTNKKDTLWLCNDRRSDSHQQIFHNYEDLSKSLRYYDRLGLLVPEAKDSLQANATTLRTNLIGEFASKLFVLWGFSLAKIANLLDAEARGLRNCLRIKIWS